MSNYTSLIFVDFIQIDDDDDDDDDDDATKKLATRLRT